MKMKNLTPVELADWLTTDLRLKPVLLDVREEWEFQAGHIDGSLAMPMNTIPARLSELDTQQPIVCICHHGVRSMQVALFLERNGFTDIRNLTGGVHAWSQQVDSAIPIY
ncbi:rhodanese-like domain-containing protein [Pseudomonas sp. MH9.2]|uniref:rhodanese-like domain-containing protein n=1 Tax=unclassified Pseudomonas TaxID=196821 RepID=UPI002AC94B0E|nr:MULTISPECIES: rhodanese-like domain-containing protein [unclassified Pseudomonas]MEB0027360.1 rhodanese-like domain-containing protein [Pseudomonas sp. MH9.2]MEB0150229.1 rhodanese-like domain-containing protein [Pseudomonas sp. CCC2.2]MEE3507495.1 rhodanese-like domain-containing protein [Pseudomonas sp. 10C3]WPX68832.1 rhodanese-like domain-containing protein [Pseudomonas sp. MH9.2]